MIRGSPFPRGIGERSIHSAPGIFAAMPVRWEHGSGRDLAFVDAVLHHAAPIQRSFRDTPLRLAFAIELLSKNQSHSRERLTAESLDDQRVRWHWDGLDLTAPSMPAAFLW